MSSLTTLIATVEADHTVKVPDDLAVGEQVMIVRSPNISALLRDPERRARFAALRAVVRDAAQWKTSDKALSDEEIVALVKQARKATQDS